MANRQHVAALRDPEKFQSVFGGTTQLRGDFSGAKISFDFSGQTIRSNFSDAVLDGSKFHSAPAFSMAVASSGASTAPSQTALLAIL
jgi:hypothetical protein